jgi:hypothetical protein
MIISQHQMEVLGQAQRRAGNLRLAQYIESRFPGLMGARDLEEQITVVEKYRGLAAGLNFINDDQVGVYMDLTVMYGASFSAIPAFQAILSDDAISADEKITCVRSLLLENGVVL